MLLFPATSLPLPLNITAPADDHSRVVLKEVPGVEGSDYINASFIDVSCKQRVKSILHHSAYFCHRDMVTKSTHTLPLKVSPPLRVKKRDKLCNMYICIFSSSSSTRTTARVIGTVLEDGVGAPAAHYCDAHQLCGGWEGESRDVCPLDTASCVLQLTHCCTGEVCPVLA